MVILYCGVLIRKKTNNGFLKGKKPLPRGENERTTNNCFGGKGFGFKKIKLRIEIQWH